MLHWRARQRMFFLVTGAFGCGGFGGVVTVVLWTGTVVAPRIADMVNLCMIFRIWLAHFLGTLLYRLLHRLPLLLRDFQAFDVVRVPDFAIGNDRFHRSSTMRFEWSVDAAYNAFFGVEGAVLCARTTTFSECDDQHDDSFLSARIACTTAVMSVSHRFSPICST